MHFKSIFPSVHLESADIPADGALVLRLVHVEQTTVEGDKGKNSFKALITFESSDTRKTTWIAPVTVCRCLAAMFGDDTEQWTGRRVAVTSQLVEAFGDKVPAVRPIGSPDIEKGLRVTVPKGRGKVYIELRRTPEPGGNKPAPKSPETELRDTLAVLLRDRVTAGTATEEDVRRECVESGVCSPEYVERLCAKLFPKEVKS